MTKENNTSVGNPEQSNPYAKHMTAKAIGLLITSIGKNEKVTKVKLGIVSRELLVYMMDAEKDVRLVNRLLKVLTPMNHATAWAYFKHFLPFSTKKTEEGKEHPDHEFTVMFKGSKHKVAKEDLMQTWIADESNDIWVWDALHMKHEKKPVDYVARVQKSIKAALEHDVDIPTVINAVIEAGISADQLSDAMTVLQAPPVKIAA